MATITTEYGKLSSNKTRTVYLRIRSSKTEKRINTQVKVLESEISPRTKKITYTLLKEFENHLSKKPRAQSLYLGELRHLFREAMLEFNTEEKTIIKSDPFIRYKVPKQVMKKGVRALTLEELIKVYHYQGKTGSRAQLARDTFILSFCLMGMNSVDNYTRMMTLFQWMGIDTNDFLYGIDHVGRECGKSMCI